MQRVLVFSLARRGRRWLVKWRVDGVDRTRSFPSKSVADRFRSDLLRARDTGRWFDPSSGEPDQPRAVPTFVEYASGWFEAKWPTLSPNGRRSLVDGLVEASLVLTSGRLPDLAEARRALREVTFCGPGSNGVDEAMAAAAQQAVDRSLRLNRIGIAETAQVLVRYGQRSDGSPAAATTRARKRAALHSVLGRAVSDGWLPANPLGHPDLRGRGSFRPVDVHRLPSVSDTRRVLERLAEMRSVNGPKAAAFCSVVLLAGLRPSEVDGLDVSDLTLPTSGWGSATVRRSVTSTTIRFSGSGEAVTVASPKHRAAGSQRVVPVPPELVNVLRGHLSAERREVGRVFVNGHGRPLSQQVSQLWRKARTSAELPDEVARVRIYDLRHMNATVLLNAGVPVAEVARRLGHGVDVLLRVYANALVDDAERFNDQVESAWSCDWHEGLSTGTETVASEHVVRTLDQEETKGSRHE